MMMLANFVNNIKTITKSYKPYFKCGASVYKIELASVLFKQNIIRGFFIKKDNNKNYLFMLLKYDTAINIFQSVSICNKNQSCVQLVKNKNGLSLSIISTKIGLIPIVKAKKCKIGGSQLIKIN